MKKRVLLFTLGIAFAISNALAYDFKNALSFDGQDDRLVTASIVSFNTFPMTYEAWVQIPHPVDWGGIVSTAAESGPWSQFVINGSGHLRYEDNDNSTVWSTDGNINVADGNWHHVAVTNNGTTLTFYVDGNVDKSIAHAPNSTTFNEQMNIFQNRHYDRSMAGLVDEVRIWNVARTQAQIQANMFQDVSSEANLLAYYKFDQGTAGGNNTGITTVTDTKGLYDAVLNLNPAG